MISTTQQRVVGQPLDRIDGPKKVTGTAPYAYEYSPDDVTYAFPVQSTIAKGRIASIDTSAAQAIPGVITVLTHENAPCLKEQEGELAVLQSNAVAYRGQFVSLVVAETLEVARQGAEAVIVRYEERPHDVELSTDRSDLYKPTHVSPNYETDTASGDVEAALAQVAVSIDHTYRTPAEHNNPLEPHATVARWGSDGVTLYDTNKGSHPTRDTVARVFGLEPERVRVIAPYVGGAFGSKGATHPHVILTVMAAQVVGRPVKFALTRQQMFALAGYRTPTIQRVQLGAQRDGQLTAIAHEVVEQTATIDEFAEPTAVPTRVMYAAPNRRTTHRLARLNLPVNSWMRPPVRPRGCSPSNRRWTSSRLPWGSIPSSCACATNRRSTPRAGVPSVAATWSPACGKGRSASAGSRATQRRAYGERDAGSSAPASPPQPIRPSNCPRVRSYRSMRRGTTRCALTPAILGTAPGPCSPRSRPMRWRCRLSACTRDR